jgi:hypothetical protein
MKTLMSGAIAGFNRSALPQLKEACAVDTVERVIT